MNNPDDSTSLAPAKQLQLSADWDKVFPKSDKADHRKVTFVDRYGITLSASRTEDYHSGRYRRAGGVVDLYGDLAKIPMDRIAAFFTTWMPAAI